MATVSPEAATPLTVREAQVLPLIQAGRSYVEIGAELGISKGNVQGVVNRLRRKFAHDLPDFLDPSRGGYQSDGRRAPDALRREAYLRRRMSESRERTDRFDGCRIFVLIGPRTVAHGWEFAWDGEVTVKRVDVPGPAAVYPSRQVVESVFGADARVIEIHPE